MGWLNHLNSISRCLDIIIFLVNKSTIFKNSILVLSMQFVLLLMFRTMLSIIFGVAGDNSVTLVMVSGRVKFLLKVKLVPFPRSRLYIHVYSC